MESFRRSVSKPLSIGKSVISYGFPEMVTSQSCSERQKLRGLPDCMKNGAPSTYNNDSEGASDTSMAIQSNAGMMLVAPPSCNVPSILVAAPPPSGPLWLPRSFGTGHSSIYRKRTEERGHVMLAMQATSALNVCDVYAVEKTVHAEALLIIKLTCNSDDVSQKSRSTTGVAKVEVINDEPADDDSDDNVDVDAMLRVTETQGYTSPHSWHSYA
ncbi:hypothetical protein HPB51_018007 [Rhipicephalus microplus]|uniref:Uncharacterized protein n=1 Tax=Rhipicephalus microplus TaxID=6941 RepID=A0A9J6D6M8_RHIMP|nr:hypothetical protein HPB51_018007 [Rhipicephalus microplus]